MIELRGVSKFFRANNVNALNHADFTLVPGEIHALLGENGAGKSTLMHIMAGYLTPDAGRVIVDGKERRFKSTADALASGIGMVRQHPHAIRGFKVWENCILGAEKTKPHIAEISARWGFELDLESPAESLSSGGRQKAAILALLLRDTRRIILDEPAAVLSPAETETLFDLLRRLKEAGRSIVLISHKLDETLAIADHVTVLRRGKTIAALEASSVSPEDLAPLIFGEKDGWDKSGPEPPKVPPQPLSISTQAAPGAEVKNNITAEVQAEPVLSIRNLRVEVPGLPVIRSVNLELGSGKILGIAGIKDSGLETLELALTGFLGGNFSGTILLNGKKINSVRSFRESGGVYLGTDRLGKNIVPRFPIGESLIIHAHRRSRLGAAGKFGIMNKRFLDSFCQRIMNRAGVKRPPENRADSFSGGMIQRILLAREFEEDASLFILAGSGAGLDQQNREKLNGQLRAMASSGRSIILFSTDPDELLGAADKILVLRNGSFEADVSAVNSTESAAREIRMAMVGS